MIAALGYSGFAMHLRTALAKVPVSFIIDAAARLTFRAAVGIIGRISAHLPSQPVGSFTPRKPVYSQRPARRRA